MISGLNFKGNAFVGPVLLGVTAGSLVIFMTNGSYLLEMALGISATIIALCSLTLGLSILLALIIFIERGLLFSLSVPFLGGSIKPTDILISAIIIGWIMRYIFPN